MSIWPAAELIGLLCLIASCIVFGNLLWARVDSVRPMSAEVDAAAILTDSRPRTASVPGMSPAERAAIEDEITSFGEELARHPFEPAPEASQVAISWYRKALDAYEAAGRSMRGLDVGSNRPQRDLTDGWYALSALDAVLLGKPVPAREQCFFDHRHPAASTKIMWSPYGGERRWIPVCASCAERRGPQVPGTAAGTVIEGAAVDVGREPRLITTFSGRGDSIIELPADEPSPVLRIHTSLLNCYSKGAKIQAIRADEEAFLQGDNLIPDTPGSVTGRVIVPAKTTLKITALGRWSIEVWSAKAAHEFTYRASGGEGMDVFRYRGTRRGTATASCNNASRFSVDVWPRHSTSPDDKRRSSLWDHGQTTFRLEPGDLVSVSAGGGTWSIDVAEDPADPIEKAPPDGDSRHGRRGLWGRRKRD